MVSSDPCAVPESVLELRVLGQLRGQPSFTMELTKQLSTSRQRIARTLRRLEGRGWVRGEVETGDPRDLQRPLRTYYALTPDGEQALREGARLLGQEGDTAR